jgi:NAD(P)-dependent dehydrogenase (short-subunit alcohol dehydrogenase family)
MRTNLNERVAVITGATGVLGQSAAQQLAELGVRLALLSSSGEKLEQMAQVLELKEEQTLLLAVDLRQAQEVHNTAHAIQARYGRMDIVLHLVGGWTGGKSVMESNRADFTWMIDQHLWTTLNVVQAFTPHLVTNGWGRIIAVSSPAATQPPARMSAYATGKAAQETLLLSLAQELKGSGVTANILQVKTIDTKREKIHIPSPDNTGWSTPEEIMAAVVYLCSEEAGAVNGARLALFGG